MGLHDEADQVLARSELRLYLIIVNRVVAVVRRRREDGCQPDDGHAQVFQVVELLGDAPQVAHAITIGVVETAHKNLVHHGVARPSGRLDRRQVSRREGGWRDTHRAAGIRRRGRRDSGSLGRVTADLAANQERGDEDQDDPDAHTTS